MNELTEEARSVEGEHGYLTVDTQHDLLAAQRRRLALDVLAERSVPVSLDDLANVVAAREDSDGVNDHHRTVKITLHHTHLPKLDDADIVDYDPDSRQVESFQPL